MIDLLYPIGGGSAWQDNELRYSLRSVEKHLKGFRDIYIVGKSPDFLKDVIHIPCDDGEPCKESNIKKKISRGCQEPSLSDDFLFFNDDHFLLQDVEASQFPFYCKGDLVLTMQHLKPNNLYRRSVERTARTLSGLQLSTTNFDTHTPIIYNKQKFLEVMDRYDWNSRFGYVVKSLYANTLKIQGIREPDCKIAHSIIAEQIYQKIDGRKVFSINDKAINDQFKIVIEQLYPNPSRWER